MKSRFWIFAALGLMITGLFGCRTDAPIPGTTALLDKDLSRFEVWLGVPHSSVQGLPAGTYQSDNVHNGTPMGLNRDLKNVFSVIEEDGDLVLHVSGEIYGGLTTKEEFQDYHLSLQFRWGDKKWPPREEKKRDSGILYHCHGEHGSFWKVWKSCLEFQVQETDLGDFIPLAGPRASIRGERVDGHIHYLPELEVYCPGNDYVHACMEPDAPHGEWNRLDLYVVGNDAIHVVNGEVVMVVENALRADGLPLTRGQIQLQSEAAECFYKDITITPISDFPVKLKNSVRFQSPDERDFSWLFNGKNFNGWYLKLRSGDAESAKKVFTVNDKGWVHVFGPGFEDGHELNSGRNDTHGMMYTNRKFDRFIFRFEYMWGKKRVNNFKSYQYDAGMYYHVYDDNIWPGGVEYQVRYDHLAERNHTGDFWAAGKSRFTWTADAPKGNWLPATEGGALQEIRDGEHRAHKDAPFHALDGQWNQCEVIVMGDRYAIHKLNGKVVNVGTELTVSEGILGLQSETAELFYRNIRIKKLDADLPIETFLK